MKQAHKAFSEIAVDRSVKRPVIGVVGEIYVRCNRFSNDNLVKTLEDLGAEVKVPPVAEWIFYTNHTSKKKNWSRGNYGNFFRTAFNDFFQHRYEDKLMDAFGGEHEPRTKDILKFAAPYINETFEGEAVLSIGKVVDYITNDIDGIMNAMPFTCMPGTIVNGILKRVREDYDNIPLFEHGLRGHRGHEREDPARGLRASDYRAHGKKRSKGRGKENQGHSVSETPFLSSPLFTPLPLGGGTHPIGWVGLRGKR